MQGLPLRGRVVSGFRVRVSWLGLGNSKSLTLRQVFRWVEVRVRGRVGVRIKVRVG